MSPEKTHQERLEPTPARHRAKGKARWGSFDEKATQIRSLFSNNPTLAILTATGLGIMALGKTKTAQAEDKIFIGRNQVVDRGDINTNSLDYTSSPLGSTQTILGGIKFITPPGGGAPYIIASRRDPNLGDVLVKITNLFDPNPTILPPLSEPVNFPREFDYDETIGVWSVTSHDLGVTPDEAVACDANDTSLCERYQLNTGKNPIWAALIQNGATSFIISVDIGDSQVRLYDTVGDADGDNFPDDTTPTEMASASLGINANPQGAWYDRSRHVLYVITHDTSKLWAFDIDETTLAIQNPREVCTFTFQPHDLIPSPNGNYLVVGGDSGTTPYGATFTLGSNAAAINPAIGDTPLAVAGRPLSDYQSFAFASNGSLWAFIKQNGGSNPGYAIELDLLTFTPTGNQITFGGNSLDAGTIAQEPSILDPDNDGDGVPASLDCNDTDASAWEESEFWVDVDGDLVGDDTVPSDWFCGATEAAASGYTATVGGDCDDGDATIFPGATEVCDGVDQNCVDGADEGLPPSDWYDDSGDEDGFGDPATTTSGCAEPTAPGLWVLQGGDCAPANSSAYPGAPEPSCGGPDLNCDETSPPACSGDTDGDGDGFTPDEGDCNDSDPTINPGAPEVCGGADEDCDGQENEGDAQDAVLLWTDGDGDGRGLPGAAELGCEGTPGTATQDGDCNDGDASVYPDAPEYADGHDKDCDTHPSAASGVAITDATDDTLIGNFSIPAANGPNYIKGLGQSFNVKFTQMARVYDEILDETQEFLGYQVVNSASNGTLTISREPGGLPVYVHQRPESAPADYIPTWTAAVTGTVLEVLHQPSGISRLTVVEGTSVEFESNFYDVDLWEAYFEAHPEASDSLILSGPNQWMEVDEDTGEITATNVQEIQNFLNFAEKYQQGDDDSGDDDSGDDDTGDDDTQDDDDIGDDDTTPPEADDDETQGDDDSAGEGPDCEEGCNTFGKSPGKGHPIEAILIMLGLAGAAFRRRFRRSQSGSNLEAPAMIEELRGRVDLVARAANQNPGTATSSFRSAIARTMRGNRAIIKARRREQRNSA